MIHVKRPETIVRFVPDGELYARHAQLNRQLGEARNRRLADQRLVDPVQQLARQVVQLEEEMRAVEVGFKLRGLPRRRWDILVAENPPRNGVQVDQQRGYSLAGVAIKGIPECIVEVTQGGEVIPFDVAKEWDLLADEMTDSQYEDFQVGLLAVNRGENAVPFSQLAWRETAD